MTTTFGVQRRQGQLATTPQHAAASPPEDASSALPVVEQQVASEPLPAAHQPEIAVEELTKSVIEENRPTIGVEKYTAGPRTITVDATAQTLSIERTEQSDSSIHRLNAPLVVTWDDVSVIIIPIKQKGEADNHGMRELHGGEGGSTAVPEPAKAPPTGEE